MKYCYGVDIGGTTVKLGLFTDEGKLIEKWEIVTNTENKGEAILPDVCGTIKENINKNKLDKSMIIGLGVGIPGPVDKFGRVKSTANLGWDFKDIKLELEEGLDLPVKVGNDANIAALGEMWVGGGAGYENLIVITLGTGVGGGIIINGRPLVGEHGAGGEIGHMRVNMQEETVCGCGRKGCLEQYASATGIARLARKRLEKDGAPSLLREREVSAKSVFDCLKEGDAIATEIVEEFSGILGDAIASLCVVVDPAVVVIGGGVSKAGEILIQYVKKHFEAVAFFANTELKFALAELGNDAGIYGGAKLILGE
ncbi:glucokinase [Aequitasia blattaphilus]|uniref:Glucokinase n=1 Tax=Aequitasia blattaphilus TaxID=2949332 RepID=A0ABT1E768_9FIRM|nr:ROK family glucokinase [Aequitasia blattaphilus]MCP1101454.1 ROK family glucokinase [Aequitasia blattaphilus]MCR8614094.1 ROK family glucokinase [Aequitasia blattaphilus]